MKIALKIAMIGTRGIPARYGGFETAVEEVGRRIAAQGHQVTVFSRGAGAARGTHMGMRSVRLPALRSKITETLSHTSLSVLHPAALRADAAIVFNVANAPLIRPLQLAKVPVAVHVDGLEWKRAKWGPRAAAYYRWCERIAVSRADALIADARGIQSYYQTAHNASTVFIPYGATVVNDSNFHRLRAVGLEPGSYFLVVARFEPENHVDLIVQAYLDSGVQRPLVVVGAGSYSRSFSEQVLRLAAKSPQVKLLGAVWDQALLDELYAGGKAYLHGHSVGGTNPSLLRAMGAGTPVLAYDVDFNREVLGETGTFWGTARDLAELLRDTEQDRAAGLRRGVEGRQRVMALYNWDAVANEYLSLCESLAGHRRGTDFEARVYPDDLTAESKSADAHSARH